MVRGQIYHVAPAPAEVPSAPGSFRMMLLPKVVDERKGGASFKRAKGRGLVQVKCEENLLADPGSSVLVLRLSVRGGGGAEPEGPGTREPARGPVRHDFAERGICGLPKEEEEWDFGKIVNGSQTFIVCLEILPPEAATGAFDTPPGLSDEPCGAPGGDAAEGAEERRPPA